MKYISFLLLSTGLILISISVYQILQSKINQEETLTEAMDLIENQTSQKKKSLPGKQTKSDRKIPYDFNPEKGETVGILHIPRLESNLPIVEGTHEDELAKGVGHYNGTAYPLQNDQIVLSGHRDTVFRRMGELDLGDILTIQLPYGDFSYEIVETQIVDADDRTIIVPTKPEEVLTVTTCYPFSYIGNAPERYIITALPVLGNE